MKSSIGLILVSFCLLLFFSSCNEDDSISNILPDERMFPNVHPDLWDYYERFENEAAERGIEIDLVAEGVTGAILEIEQDRVAGSCAFGSHISNHVTIDLEFWNRSNDVSKEFVVFHELGHCSLHREHREDAMVDGTCASIMRSGIEDCFDNYRFSTRTAYLDELFDEEFKDTL